MIESISYWESKSFQRNYDLIIVGAGFVGLSTALRFNELYPKAKILLLERGVISYGASTRNAGFACFGSIGELEEDRLSSSVEQILETIKKRWEGLKNLRKLVPDVEMEYFNNGGVELFADKETFENAAKEISSWNDLLFSIIGIEVYSIVENPNPGFYSKAIYNQYEGQLNPKMAIDFLIGLCRKKGIDIQFGQEVLSWDTLDEAILIETNSGIRYRCSKLALATNAFTSNILKDIEVLPARNQVLVSEVVKGLKWKGCYHFNKGYIYFRNVDGRILLGGARYLSAEENTMSYGHSRVIQNYLHGFLNDKIVGNKTEIDHWWSGILGIGAKKNPIITKYADRIYCAVRLGGMGVAIGTSVGKDLAELILHE